MNNLQGVEAPITFTCDFCAETKPVAEREIVEAATLSPYPEDAALCPTCAAINDWSWREILQRRREVEEENRDYDQEEYFG